MARAFEWHSKGQGFNSPYLQNISHCIKKHTSKLSSVFLCVFPRMIVVLSLLALTGAIATLVINLIMVKGMEKYVYTDINQLPSRTAVMVLGAQTHGINLSPILQDRVNGGIAVFRSGKGQKLLLSGDHGEPFYDEVTAMRLYVVSHAEDIPHEHIFMDYAGFSTWDSMYRARDIFEVDGLIIVTQGFHISRAVCMARSLGIDAVGYAVDEERFRGRSLRTWQFREYFARVKALHSIVFRIRPKFLGDRIPIVGDGRSSWI